MFNVSFVQPACPSRAQNANTRQVLQADGRASPSPNQLALFLVNFDTLNLIFPSWNSTLHSWLPLPSHVVTKFDSLVSDMFSDTFPYLSVLAFLLHGCESPHRSNAQLVSLASGSPSSVLLPCCLHGHFPKIQIRLRHSSLRDSHWLPELSVWLGFAPSADTWWRRGY